MTYSDIFVLPRAPNRSPTRTTDKTRSFIPLSPDLLESISTFTATRNAMQLPSSSSAMEAWKEAGLDEWKETRANNVSCLTLSRPTPAPRLPPESTNRARALTGSLATTTVTPTPKILCHNGQALAASGSDARYIESRWALISGLLTVSALRCYHSRAEHD